MNSCPSNHPPFANVRTRTDLVKLKTFMPNPFLLYIYKKVHTYPDTYPDRAVNPYPSYLAHCIELDFQAFIFQESYDAVRHDVVGVTRQAIPLDGVISDVSGHDNRSFNSDPSVHIRVTSLSSSNEMPR